LLEWNGKEHSTFAVTELALADCIKRDLYGGNPPHNMESAKTIRTLAKMLDFFVSSREVRVGPKRGQIITNDPELINQIECGDYLGKGPGAGWWNELCDRDGKVADGNTFYFLDKDDCQRLEFKTAAVAAVA
jgi:hypothetical protein